MVLLESDGCNSEESRNDPTVETMIKTWRLHLPKSQRAGVHQTFQSFRIPVEHLVHNQWTIWSGPMVKPSLAYVPNWLKHAVCKIPSFSLGPYWQRMSDSSWRFFMAKSWKVLIGIICRWLIIPGAWEGHHIESCIRMWTTLDTMPVRHGLPSVMYKQMLCKWQEPCANQSCKLALVLYNRCCFQFSPQYWAQGPRENVLKDVILNVSACSKLWKRTSLT